MMLGLTEQEYDTLVELLSAHAESEEDFLQSADYMQDYFYLSKEESFTNAIYINKEGKRDDEYLQSLIKQHGYESAENFFNDLFTFGKVTAEKKHRIWIEGSEQFQFSSHGIDDHESIIDADGCPSIVALLDKASAEQIADLPRDTNLSSVRKDENSIWKGWYLIQNIGFSIAVVMTLADALEVLNAETL